MNSIFFMHISDICSCLFLQFQPFYVHVDWVSGHEALVGLLHEGLPHGGLLLDGWGLQVRNFFSERSHMLYYQFSPIYHSKNGQIVARRIDASKNLQFFLLLLHNNIGIFYISGRGHNSWCPALLLPQPKLKVRERCLLKIIFSCISQVSIQSINFFDFIFIFKGEGCEYY